MILEHIYRLNAIWVFSVFYLRHFLNSLANLDSCYYHLPYVLFVAVKLYLFLFPSDTENFM